ncbi:hemolysin family protein [Actinotalea sp. M2MS4P-6]|uniref:hemolysin family protein n=1 Tax=Actinotalea sp. M2MS4P-6 TaxID=2983762 RepID=UPI0021E46273|nr:hemolysin family protein [Actinotalea sp. M2MS4P-6]MCV2393927.1 hemolysin family protein [Actinotalea sp. M2MS4P-6]
MTAAWLAAGALVAVLLAAGLSAGEAGLHRLSRSAIAALATPTPSGRRVARFAHDPQSAAAAAATVQVLLEVATAVLVTLSLAMLGWSWWQVLLLALPLVSALALVVVRHLPRRLGRTHPAAVVLASSGLLTAALLVASRVRLSGRTAAEQQELSDDELRDMVDRVSESEAIEDDERELFHAVLELGETLTRAVMVPRTEMITLPRGTPVRKALSLFLRSGYSRVPLVGDSDDDVLGVLYLKDLVRHRHLVERSDSAPVDSLARPAVFVPESKPVDELLREMQRGSSHLALVVDEFGGIAGLVTMEDALEEIVGELTDEHDRTGPEVEDLGDGRFRVPARLPVDELGELFDLDLEDEDVDTAAGLLAKALGKVPLAGARAEVSGLELVADRVEGRRKQVSTLLVSRVEEE